VPIVQVSHQHWGWQSYWWIVEEKREKNGSHAFFQKMTFFENGNKEIQTISFHCHHCTQTTDNVNS